jgi:hypothetical protein
MDKKYIVNIQGKDFVTYEGLLDDFHKTGGKSIKTRLVGFENDLYVFKAVAEGEKGTFHGYGDAGISNVGKMIQPHILRMAETRAKARALRDYCNVGLCSVEELGEGERKKKGDYRLGKTTSIDNVGSVGKCVKCGDVMTFREGVSKTGKAYKGYFCKCGEKKWINL